MSGGFGGLGAAISKPGDCLREVFVGPDKRVVRHKWRLNGEKGYKRKRARRYLLPRLDGPTRWATQWEEDTIWAGHQSAE